MSETKKQDQAKLEVLSELKKKLKELESNPFTEAIIKDNKIPFKHEKTLYRCVMPSQSDLTQGKDHEDETRIRLLRKKDTISRKELKKLLKKNQNIDIDKFEEEKKEVVKEINEAYLTLNRIQDLNKELINKSIDKIKELLDKFQDIGYEISVNISSCIENKQEVAYIRFLTACCTEKQDSEGQWVRVWKEFENFEADRTILSTIAEYWFSRLYVQTRS